MWKAASLRPMTRKKDAEILAALRTNNLSPETDLEALVKEAEELKGKLDAHAAEVSDDEKRYKTLTDMIKKAAIQQFREGDKRCLSPVLPIPGKSARVPLPKSIRTL